MNEMCRQANAYLDERTGTYEFRCRRYRAVLDKMKKSKLGILTHDVVVDVGAGRCEFGRCIRYDLPSWRGLYIPLDAAIDGIDLANMPRFFPAEFYVAIEFIEHLPLGIVEWYLENLPKFAKIMAVITTPNPETTDVLGMDRTHKTPVSREMLKRFGWHVARERLFTKELDTLVAWKDGV